MWGVLALALCVSAAPLSADARFKEGQAAFARGDGRAALHDFYAAARDDARTAQERGALFLWIARSYLLVGDEENAARAMIFALQEDPSAQLPKGASVAAKLLYLQVQEQARPKVEERGPKVPAPPPAGQGERAQKVPPPAEVVPVEVQRAPTVQPHPPPVEDTAPPVIVQPPAAPPAGREPPRSEPSPIAARMGWVGGTALASGAALVGVGAGALAWGALASNAAQDQERTQVEAVQLYKSGQRRLVVGATLVGLGAASAAAGGTLLVVELVE